MGGRSGRRDPALHWLQAARATRSAFLPRWATTHAEAPLRASRPGRPWPGPSLTQSSVPQLMMQGPGKGPRPPRRRSLSPSRHCECGKPAARRFLRPAPPLAQLYTSRLSARSKMARGSSSSDRRSAPAPHRSRGAGWGGTEGGAGRGRTDSLSRPSRPPDSLWPGCLGVRKDARPSGPLRVVGFRQLVRPTLSGPALTACRLARS